MFYFIGFPIHHPWMDLTLSSSNVFFMVYVRFVSFKGNHVVDMGLGHQCNHGHIADIALTMTATIDQAQQTLGYF